MASVQVLVTNLVASGARFSSSATMGAPHLPLQRCGVGFGHARSTPPPSSKIVRRYSTTWKSRSSLGATRGVTASGRRGQQRAETLARSRRSLRRAPQDRPGRTLGGGASRTRAFHETERKVKHTVDLSTAVKGSGVLYYTVCTD